MDDPRHQERIDKLRSRLYSRGRTPNRVEAFAAQKKQQPQVTSTWGVPKDQQKPKLQFSPKNETPVEKKIPETRAEKPTLESTEKQASSTRQQSYESVSSRPITSESAAKTSTSSTPVATAAPVGQDTAMAPQTKKPKRRYRMKLLIFGFAVFGIAVIVSSFNLFIGDGNISGDNIDITLDGPFAVGGGEALQIQIGVANNNTVPIEAATLIIEYPPGTQSAVESGKELYVERLPLETITPGQVINVPLRAVMYGDENEEKVINAEIEYRIKGSNSTFAKKAEPYRFKITSSPVVLNVEALERIASGEEAEITLTLQSNATTEINNVLVKAEYPFSFDFKSADPAPVSGENIWRVDSLEPEGSYTITLRGTIEGQDSDVQVLHFSSGLPSETDELEMVSVFSSASTEFTIERPFFEVQVDTGSLGGQTGVIAPENNTQVSVGLKNTLPDAIYDTVVVATLSGNALADTNVQSGSGFYDSIENTITWDVSSVPELGRIDPGDERVLSFNLRPSNLTERTPQIAINTLVKARRVFDQNATEQTLGNEDAVIKVATDLRLIAETGYDSSTFDDTGSIPPVAEEETTYTLSFMLTNTTNDVGTVVLKAVLPTYVKWLDKTSGAGAISFNDTTREVFWEVGDIEANQSKIGSFQVSFLPSVTQIGTKPTLLGRMTATAVDRFTNVKLQVDHNALTTEMSPETGYPEHNGRVQE